MKKIAEAHQPLRGEITVPGDKSIGHRAVIFGSIAHGGSRIFNLSGGEDNQRTVEAFRSMGVSIRPEADALCIEGRGWDGLSAPNDIIDCGNSGTTMRLLSGVMAGRSFTSRLDGDGSLRRRPMQRIIDPLTSMGAQILSRDGKGLAPLEIHGGKLHAIDYHMPVASAQVKSCVLFAGLLADGRTTVIERRPKCPHNRFVAMLTPGTHKWNRMNANKLIPSIQLG